MSVMYKCKNPQSLTISVLVIFLRANNKYLTFLRVIFNARVNQMYVGIGIRIANIDIV